MPPSGALLKARRGRDGLGTRSGFRITCCHYAPRGLYYLLALYPKRDKEDLSVDELRVLKRLVDTLIEALERAPSSCGSAMQLLRIAAKHPEVFADLEPAR